MSARGLVVAVVAAVLAAASVLAVPRPGARRAMGAAGDGRRAPAALDLVLGRRRRRRRDAAYEEALPALLEAAAGHLRSGSSLRVALVDAASDAPPSAFAPLVDPLASGAPIADAVDAWAGARPDRATRLAAAAVSLAAAMGGGAARSLDAVAATLRDRRALAREVRAQSAQARLSATVVGAAPVAFAVIAAGLDARTLSFLVTPPVGLACLLGGVGLDVFGLLWMRLLLRGATR